MKTAGIILAGGESTRFGEDKSLYSIEGQAMYLHVAETLQSVCDDVVISTNARLSDQFKLKTVTDTNDGLGPVGGLYSVCERYPGWRLVVLSCDTPFVTKAWLQILIEYADKNPEHTIISTDGTRLHPLIGVYQGDSLKERLQHQIDTKRLSMRALFEHIPIKTVDVFDHSIPADIFKNINYKSDLG